MASLRLAVACEDRHPPFMADDHTVPAVGADHTWVDHLIEEVSVISATRGRIRFKLAFEGDEILSDSLRREVQRIDSVKLAAYSVRTRTALVTYDPKITDAVEVTVALLRGVKEFARTRGECDLDHHHHSRAKKKVEDDCCGHSAEVEDDCDHDHRAMATDAGIRKELFKLTLAGAALGYFVYKRVKTPVTIVAAASSPISLASFITIASGYQIFRDGYKSVRDKKKATDDTLIGLAVGASLLMGESLTGLSVVWLIQLGRVLEAVTLKRSRTAVKELMDLTPTEAWLVTSNNTPEGSLLTRRAKVEEIEKGQVVRVFHGEKVPLDGKIVRGTGLLKESFLTGESIPREKTIDDTVYAGSVVEAGEIDIQVTSVIHDTVVATMIDAMENIRDNKAPIEKVGQRFAQRFVPISIGISAVTFLLTGDLRRAITMLVIACPCAAGLATPTAVSASIGQVARKGILIKGGAHLESGAKVDTIVFDKTGTLTLGAPVLHHFVPTESGAIVGEAECLRLAASAEQHTTHPLGLVLVNEAKTKRLAVAPVEEYLVHEGRGVSATVEGRKVMVGSRRFMEEASIGIPQASETSALRGFHAGESVLYLAIDGDLQGLYVVEDKVRPEAREMLSRLRKIGINRFLMATGDQKISANHIAGQLGITEVHAELLPTGKLELVRELKAQGHKVAMMGDGVNDAAALTEADLSIAMGASRCDVAIETADVTIAREDLKLVAEFFDVSKKTLRTIRQNYVAAVGINAAGLVYSASGNLSLFGAAIVHNASTIAVVLNSLRLGRNVAGENPLKVLREVKI